MNLNRLYFAKSSLAQLNFSKGIARHDTETTQQYSPDCAVLAHSQMTDHDVGHWCGYKSTFNSTSSGSSDLIARAVIRPKAGVA